MNVSRRKFLAGTFVLGCALALGLRRPSTPKVQYFDGVNDYTRASGFKLKDPKTAYFVALHPQWFSASTDGTCRVSEDGQNWVAFECVHPQWKFHVDPLTGHLTLRAST